MSTIPKWFGLVQFKVFHCVGGPEEWRDLLPAGGPDAGYFSETTIVTPGIAQNHSDLVRLHFCSRGMRSRGRRVAQIHGRTLIRGAKKLRATLRVSSLQPRYTFGSLGPGTASTRQLFLEFRG